MTLQELPPGQTGLTTEEVKRRLAVYGPNQLVPEKRQHWLVTWAVRLGADPMVVLLGIAATTYFLLQEYVDAVITLLAIIPVFLVGLVLQARAERTLQQLKRLTTPSAAVWRDGNRRTVPADQIVPGDLVQIQEGAIIPADGELVAGSQVIVDEATLTGESQPVEKDAAEGPAARQVFAGTTVLAGRGIVRVTVTGPRTRYGAISTLVATIKQPPTPFQRLIHRLTRQLGVIAVVICAAVTGLELVRTGDWGAAIVAGVSLAMAALPEEFPVVYTLYLTLGAWRLARHRALVRNLPSVETLGATSVICSDKTGTLTLGRLAVAAVSADSTIVRAGEQLPETTRALLEGAVLASEPGPFDPLEQAILRFALAQGVAVASLHAGTLVRDYPFDRVQNYMSHVWQHDDTLGIYAKGALEGILNVTRAPEKVREWAVTVNEELASQGIRVIAVAGGRLATTRGNREEDEMALHFLGLIGVSDPLRTGVAEALEECRSAGIRVIMITGDHPLTAHAVAEALNLPHEADPAIVTGADLDAADDEELAKLVRHVNIFARTRPDQKYSLVRALRATGEVVAMTGDGVNDAPALREADIGIAMGERGTEVARAAATLVLLDDNFATIVAAIRDGRRIFENLQRVFSYLIAFHIPILLAAIVIPLTSSPLFLLPVHLVLLEIFLHPVVALVFENEPASPDVMRRPPRRPDAPLIQARHLVRPLATGLTLFGGVLVLFLVSLARGGTDLDARALALTALIVGQFLLVLSERSPREPVWRSHVGKNPALLVTAVAVLLGLIAMHAVPFAATVLKITPLPVPALALAVAVAFATTMWVELWKVARLGRADR